MDETLDAAHPNDAFAQLGKLIMAGASPDWIGTRRHGAGRLELAHQRQNVVGEGVGSLALCLGTLGPGGRQVHRIAQRHALRLLRGESHPGPLADQGAFLLGQGRIDVQHERVAIGAQLGDDKRHPLRH